MNRNGESIIFFSSSYINCDFFKFFFTDSVYYRDTIHKYILNKINK